MKVFLEPRQRNEWFGRRWLSKHLHPGVIGSKLDDDNIRLVFQDIASETISGVVGCVSADTRIDHLGGNSLAGEFLSQKIGIDA